MQYRAIEFILKGKVAELWLNRPEKRNALNAQMLEEILHALHNIETGRNVRVLVLRGRGPVFSAGADLAFIKSLAGKTDREIERAGGMFYDCFHTLFNLGLPVVCYVHGAVKGGAGGLAAASDFVITTQDTLFSFPEVQLGLVPATVAPFVVRRIGFSRSRQLMISGMEIDGTMAHRIGLADMVTGADNAEAAISQLVSGIRQNKASSVSVTKKMLFGLGGEEIINEQTRRNAIKIFRQSIRSGEAIEGINTLFDRIKPYRHK